ncbi:nuclear transport factor 2 family protein [Longimonas halophila]|nr:nuclear transport factor 2 family protein [Longimonas halophila]
MRNRTHQAAWMLLLLILATGAAPSTTRAQDSSEAVEAVRNAEEEMRQAIVEGDLQTLEQLWQPDFIVNAPRNVVVPNRQAVLEVFQAGIASYSHYAQTRDTIRVQGNRAVVMGSESVRPDGNEAPHAGQTVHRRYTHVWEATDEGWRLAVRHAHIAQVEMD